MGGEEDKQWKLLRAIRESDVNKAKEIIEEGINLTEKFNPKELQDMVILMDAKGKTMLEYAKEYISKTLKKENAKEIYELLNSSQGKLKNIERNTKKIQEKINIQSKSDMGNKKRPQNKTMDI